MSLIPERLPASSRHTLAAVGLDQAFQQVRRTPNGEIDFDHYLKRARDLRKESYAEAFRALFRAIAKPFVALARAYSNHRAHRRAVSELLSLDDRSLRDLGLNRAGVHFVVDHGREDVIVAANTNETPARSPRAA